MSQKYKNSTTLSLRQKRRRLSISRNDRDKGSEDTETSNSSLYERSENPIISELNPREKSSDDDLNIHAPPEIDETDSSNEEHTDEEIEDAGENVDEEESDENSGEENQDVIVIENPINLKKRALKNTFLIANINHKQGNFLLKTLREYPFNMKFLPKYTRTLLHTPAAVASMYVQTIAGGEYLHIGLRRTLLKKLQSLPTLPESVEIDISTNGVQVDKDLDQLWPIQFRVVNIPDKSPMIAGIFKGRHKPSNPFAFFEQFIQEIVEIREQGGISVRNHLLPVKIRCFIADAPARAFALNHYGHCSSHACSKCKIEGQRSTVPRFEGTMVFEGIRHAARTNEEYQNLVDEHHHRGKSPLSAILGLVSRVPFEVTHLIWLGNVKKLLSAKIGGKFGHQRLNARKLDILDARMTSLAMFCPSEFDHRPREITLFPRFKATEFRQFLLYTAPAVLKNVFEQDYYDHLMILHSVTRLLISEETPKNMYDWCQEALESYVRLCTTLYGQQFLSYDVHGLLHIVADVELLGGLETFSALCFENNMPKLRRCIRKPGLKLPQVYERICERDDSNIASVNNDIHVRLSQTHAHGPLPEHVNEKNYQQFHKLKVGAVTFATTLRDNCCILKDFQVCLIKNIVKLEETIFFIVQKFRRVRPIYDVGLTSDAVGIYQCSDLTETVQTVNLNSVKNKCYRMPVWSDVEGEEERAMENEWISITLLTPLIFPQN